MNKKILSGLIIFIIIFTSIIQTQAQTNLQIHVINMPVEFDGDLMALVDTMNNWNNNLSKSGNLRRYLICTKY